MQFEEQSESEEHDVLTEVPAENPVAQFDDEESQPEEEEETEDEPEEEETESEEVSEEESNED